MNIVGDLGVHNRDASPYHFLVREDKVEGKQTRYTPVMYDFGLVYFRDEYESEEEWMKAKCRQDEAGAVGVVMSSRLRKRGGNYQYQKAYKWGAYVGLEDEWRPPDGHFTWRKGLVWKDGGLI